MENTKKEDYNTGEQNKIYILGGKGVGKTNLFHLIFSEPFNEKMDPSNPGIIKCNYKRGNKEFTFKELTDDESFSTTKILKNELEEVLLIFIVFALDDKQSFEYAKTLVQFIKNNIINNKDLNIVESMKMAKSQIEAMDNKIKQKQELININGGYLNNPNLVDNIGKMLIGSVKAKLNILSKINGK